MSKRFGRNKRRTLRTALQTVDKLTSDNMALQWQVSDLKLGMSKLNAIDNDKSTIIRLQYCMPKLVINKGINKETFARMDKLQVQEALIEIKKSMFEEAIEYIRAIVNTDFQQLMQRELVLFPPGNVDYPKEYFKDLTKERLTTPNLKGKSNE